MVGLDEQPNQDLQPLVVHKIDFSAFPAEDHYVFNPTILPEGDGFRCFFRAVGPDGRRSVRRARISSGFHQEGPIEDWSSEIQAVSPGIVWIADPRAFLALGRRYITFNTGHSETPNRIFVVEVDTAGRPIGVPFEAVRTDSRRPIEKNWGFFEHAGTLYTIYSLAPLEILRCRFIGDKLVCEPAFLHHWTASHLEESYGPLHGGAGPVATREGLFIAFQSRTCEPAGYVYRGSMMSLDLEPPFGPKGVASGPLFQLDAAELSMMPAKKLNPSVDKVLYPSGLIGDPHDGTLVLSYGINDYQCGIRRYHAEALGMRLRPLTRLVSSISGEMEGACMGSVAPNPIQLRTFFWRPPRVSNATPRDIDQGRFCHGNVGDTMQAHLLGQLFQAVPLHLEQEGGRLLGIGSIAHRALPGDVIWGSGSKPVPLALTPEEKARIDVRAVRGPITLDYLKSQGLDVSRVGPFFDPGLLIGEIFPGQVADCRRLAHRPSGVMIVPHYKDTSEMLARHGDRFRIRSTDCDLFTFLADLLSAELILSSSLHGIILAEGLGIPAMLLRPPVSEAMSKYEDYYLGTGRSSFSVLDEPSAWRGARIPATPAPPAGWRETLPHLDCAHSHLVEPFVPLRLVPSCPPLDQYRQGRLHLEPGPFLGSFFHFEARLTAARPIRVRIMAGGFMMKEVDFRPKTGSLLRVGLDGALIESLGGSFCLDFRGPGGGFAMVRSVRGCPF